MPLPEMHLQFPRRGAVAVLLPLTVVVVAAVAVVRPSLLGQCLYVDLAPPAHPPPRSSPVARLGPDLWARADACQCHWHARRCPLAVPVLVRAPQPQAILRLLRRWIRTAVPVKVVCRRLEEAR